MLRIYNTLSRRKEVFKPLHSKKVNLFVCGPTVYDLAHIGHARTYIAFDIAARYMRQRGYAVHYVQNITDIEDKIITRAAEHNTDPLKFARDIEITYIEDMQALGITSVSSYERATDHIMDIVGQIQQLASKGHAYVIPDDGYYFDLKTFPEYGKLSGRTIQKAEDAVSRIDESIKKRNKGDFCLWKFCNPGEPFWQTKLGKGRPGWHIEDTAITESVFGPQYDIHGGARDLLFPHHEAEIAQMEAVSGKTPMVHIWMHTGFLLVQRTKMSKSLGNFITIRDFLKTHEPEVLRMIVASAHYRSPIDYTERVALQAQEQIKRMREFIRKLMQYSSSESGELKSLPMEKSLTSSNNTILFKKLKETEEKFYKEMDDDFNTPKAMARLMAFIRYANPRMDQRAAIVPKTEEAIETFFRGIDKIFGFNLFEDQEHIIPDAVQKLVATREDARKGKNWPEADRLRKAIEALGYAVEDTPQGTRIRKISNFQFPISKQ